MTPPSPIVGGGSVGYRAADETGDVGVVLDLLGQPGDLRRVVVLGHDPPELWRRLDARGEPDQVPGRRRRRRALD